MQGPGRRLEREQRWQLVRVLDRRSDEPHEPARSSRKPAPDERDRHFERVEKVLYWVRRTRAAKLAPDRFLTPIDYLINLNMQYRSHRRALAGVRTAVDTSSNAGRTPRSASNARSKPRVDHDIGRLASFMTVLVAACNGVRRSAAGLPGASSASTVVSSSLSIARLPKPDN